MSGAEGRPGLPLPSIAFHTCGRHCPWRADRMNRILLSGHREVKGNAQAGLDGSVLAPLASRPFPASYDSEGASGARWEASQTGLRKRSQSAKTPGFSNQVSIHNSISCLSAFFWGLVRALRMTQRARSLA